MSYILLNVDGACQHAMIWLISCWLNGWFYVPFDDLNYSNKTNYKSAKIRVYQIIMYRQTDVLMSQRTDRNIVDLLWRFHLCNSFVLWGVFHFHCATVLQIVYNFFRGNKIFRSFNHLHKSHFIRFHTQSMQNKCKIEVPTFTCWIGNIKIKVLPLTERLTETPKSRWHRIQTLVCRYLYFVRETRNKIQMTLHLCNIMSVQYTWIVQTSISPVRAHGVKSRMCTSVSPAWS